MRLTAPARAANPTMDLHALRLLIPGPVMQAFSVTPGGPVSNDYAWDCGCTAAGVELRELDVAFCRQHAVMLGAIGGGRLRWLRAL